MSRYFFLRPKLEAVSTFFVSTLLLLGTFAFPTSSAYAQSTTLPNQTNDIQFPGSGPCANKLQECIDSAPDWSTIRIAAGTHTGSLKLTRPISLIGAGADSTILQADPNQRVLLIQGAAINASVSIAFLTITGGRADENNNHEQLGGGILIEEGAAPLLHDLIVRNNYARTYGGGIAVVSTEQVAISSITIRDSIIKDNTTAGTGGGLCSNAGNTVIESSQILGNQAKHGGGLLVNGPFEMRNLYVAQNQAEEFGGGVYGGYDSKMDPIYSSLNDSRFENNQAGYQGGGAFLFNAILDHDHFQQNKVTVSSRLSGGGALAASSSMTVTKSVFIDNQAPDGGAFASLGGKTWINNSLFVDNHSVDPQSAAAISLVNASQTTRTYLSHLTIVDRTSNNSAALKTGNGEIRLNNSIVVNHVTAIFNSAGRLLEQSNLYFGNQHIIEGEAIRSSGGVYEDPQFIDPDGLNFHLRSSSPAINAGMEADVTDDFDGEPRPNGGAPDIGFDEAAGDGSVPAPLPTPQPSPTPQPTPSPEPTPLPEPSPTPTGDTGGGGGEFGIFLPIVVK